MREPRLGARHTKQSGSLTRDILRILRADIRANLGSSSLLRGTFGLLYNPGLLCVSFYRLYAWADRRGPVGKLFGICIWRFNVFVTGAYLHPRSVIGPGLRLPHPIGIVIGAGVNLGADVTIYQNTTIGVSSRTADELYPIIGDKAILYCGAVVVGGVRIGAHAIIGANAVVTKDIPQAATAVGIPARVL